MNYFGRDQIFHKKEKRQLKILQKKKIMFNQDQCCLFISLTFSRTVKNHFSITLNTHRVVMLYLKVCLFI